MKGIIFNLFEKFVDEISEDYDFDDLLEDVTLITKEEFIGPGTYPDEDLFTLVGKFIEKKGLELPDALRKFGKFCFPHLANIHPDFITPYENAKDFLLTVHDIIHVEVRKLFKDAETPDFAYHNPSDSSLIIEYKSKRNLCYLMEGLLEGVGEHFKKPFQYKQTTCTHRGDEKCTFNLNFS